MSSDIPRPLGNPAEASSTYLPPLVLVDILREQFERARRGAQLRRLWAALHRQSTALPTYSDLLDGVVPQVERPRVTQQVPIAQIVGSEGRSSDFDQAFRPLKRHMRKRWLRIALVWMEGCPCRPCTSFSLATLISYATATIGSPWRTRSAPRPSRRL